MKLSKRAATYRIDQSKIHGLGVFADRDLKSGDDIGAAVLGVNPLKRTRIGQMVNHSDHSNAVLKKWSNKYHLFAAKDIKRDDEVTVDYNQAEKELKIPIDKSFLKENCDGGSRRYVRSRSSDSRDARVGYNIYICHGKSGAGVLGSMEKTYAKIKLSKRDPLDFEVIEPLTDEIEMPPVAHDDETGEVNTMINLRNMVPDEEPVKKPPKAQKPILEEVIEPVDWSIDELEEVLKELEARRRAPMLSKRARRAGVKEEYVWMYVHGKLLVDKNVKDEKELIGVGHAGLADKAGVSPKHEFPRGFVTYYTNGDVEVQTYGISFWEMPTRVQDRVEGWFELKPGQYKVEPPLALPPGTNIYV